MEQPDIRSLKAIVWLAPWEAFPDVMLKTEGDLAGYDLELVREVGPKHPLYPYRSVAIPIGVRCDCDDRLYWIPDQQRPFVVVHLTWAGAAQQWSADHPITEFYSSFEDWIEGRMKRDHEFIRDLSEERRQGKF